MAFCVSFAPVISQGAKVLILGSMPGVKSLNDKQYYAHPRNLFWPFMHEVVGIPHFLPYKDRIALLKEKGIALWDVYAECYREGSLDKNIDNKNSQFNHFGDLFTRYPSISVIVTNGGAASKAWSCYIRYHEPLKNYLASKTLLNLPSTSPANASQSREDKLTKWQSIAAYL